MEQQQQQQSAGSDGRQRSAGMRCATGHDPGVCGREPWRWQRAGYYFYPHFAAPHGDPSSGCAVGAWHQPNYQAQHYAVAPQHHPARMPGPVFFAAPAYPHYWVPYPHVMGTYQHHEQMAGSGWQQPNGAKWGAAAPRARISEASSVACSDEGSSCAELQTDDSCSAVASSCSEEPAPQQLLQASGGWGSLTVALLQGVMDQLGDVGVKQLRLVCRHWCGVVDHNLESLTPNDLKARVLVKRFSNLKVLHLTNCSDIRNRSLWIISKAGLNLHTLTLGDDSAKPWVTNRGLECIAQMTSLTSLNLHDCSGVTNKGLAALTSLSGLASLSLRGCCKLTNAAFEALRGNSSLTSLNLHGCRLTDQGLRPLAGLQLLSLHLGNTRVRDEGLAFLAQITTLQELNFDQEQLSDVGVAQLTTLTRLQSLALRDCAHVSSDSLSVLIPALPSLISLDLYKNFTMDDSHLTRCLEFLGAVTYLDLRGTPVTEDGLQQLTKLSSLQKLCLAPTKECLWSPYLCVVSNLTQLTSLSLSNCTLISFGQLETLRQLKLLRELDLSGDSNKEESRELPSQPAVNPAIQSMASITSLTSIDLSRRPVHQEHLSTLAEGLPRLHTLIIVGCPVLYTEVQSLQRRFPDLIIHRKPLFFEGSCSSSDHGIG